MRFGSPDNGGNGKHTGVDLEEISKTIWNVGHIFLWN